MARPSRYSTKLGDAICDRIAEGESVRKIGEDESMPSARQIHRWLASDADMYKGFRQQYAHAKDEAAERFAEEIIEIADTEPDHNRARVRIDARKWTAAKLLPKKYGTDRQEITGAEGGPLTVRVIREDHAL